MNRRTFLGSIAVAVGSTQLGCIPHSSAASSGTRRLQRVGVQLYSLRDDARQDLERTLASIAGIGYRDVELLGSLDNFGMPPTRLRQVLDENGLRAPSTHVSGNALDDLNRQLEQALTLGHQYMVVASLPLQGQRTLDDYRRWADRLNDAGQRTVRQGIHIGFHNHGNDHTPIGGVVPYDVLVERTDPAFVRLQLDTGNAAMGGRDPLEYLQRYRERYWLFHIKDVPRLGATSDAELGKGVIDFRRLLAGIEGIADKLLFVEQETYPGTPLESVRRDYAYISALEF
ncbi:MAG: sugar phosphate isomerase/epimerase [Gemmatimonadaceae bacterium]